MPGEEEADQILKNPSIPATRDAEEGSDVGRGSVLLEEEVSVPNGEMSVAGRARPDETGADPSLQVALQVALQVEIPFFGHAGKLADLWPRRPNLPVNHLGLCGLGERPKTNSRIHGIYRIKPRRVQRAGEFA